MSEDTSNNSNINKLELALWLIDRHDKLREITANRAAMVLSADALLLTGIIFILDRIISVENYFPNLFTRILFLLSIGITILLIVLSILFAISGITGPRKSSRLILGPRVKERLFFNARDTLEHFDNSSSLEESFIISSKEEQLSYALGELYTIQYLYLLRYQILRKAIFLFLI
jgi:hypothetical protein